MVSVATSDTTYYMGAFEYKNDRLNQVFTEEGRIRYDDANDAYNYDYYLKDHLGNIRVVFTGDGNGNAEALQVNNYYPFGMRFNQAPEKQSQSNDYLYNGKELQKFGLNWYDYGARMYDAQLGRWYVLDRASEYNIRLTPYNYSFNNPIRFVDPDGNLPEDVTNKANYYMGTWYEFGGKNPFYIGGTGVDQTDAWLTSAIIYAGYKKTGFSHSFYKKSIVYALNSISVPKGYSVGIDCSGLSRLAFNADPDKHMSDLPNGAHNQMKAFSDAEEKGTGLLHTDFNQIKEGDLVFNTEKRTNKQGEKYDRATHVMIATGRVDRDSDGNVTKFEVIHASRKGEPVKKEMINVAKHQRIGHTNRDGDLIMNTHVSKEKSKGMSWSDFYNWVSQNNLYNKIK
jgi:RHS repeat-associated protein